MTKKNIQDLMEQESKSLNNILEKNDLSTFKNMVEELRDTWTKKQMYRTETEMRFSVLQDNKYPTKASKYWQCVREQASFLENLIGLSFDYRRNDAKIKWLEKKIQTETDEYKVTKYKITRDECRFTLACLEKNAHHRIREIKTWSKLKKEFDDGSFDTKDVNKHQLDSYGIMYSQRAQQLTENTPEPEKFNIIGQYQSLQRIKSSGELENNTEEKKEIIKK